MSHQYSGSEKQGKSRQGRAWGCLADPDIRRPLLRHLFPREHRSFFSRKASVPPASAEAMLEALSSVLINPELRSLLLCRLPRRHQMVVSSRVCRLWRTSVRQLPHSSWTNDCYQVWLTSVLCTLTFRVASAMVPLPRGLRWG